MRRYLCLNDADKQTSDGRWLHRGRLETHTKYSGHADVCRKYVTFLFASIYENFAPHYRKRCSLTTLEKFILTRLKKALLVVAYSTP